MQRESVQLQVGRAIEMAALPYYRRPFPRVPRALTRSGHYVPLANPFFGSVDGVRLDYDTYRDRINRGLSPPRSIHGPMHAARVALWAGLLSVMFERFDLGSVGDLFSLQMAAAFHDAGRQDEGSDEWETASEDLFRRWHNRACNPSGCPPTHPESVVIRRSILHDADTLDILRVLPSRNAFVRSRLSFTDDPRIPEEFKRDLIAEVDILIRATEVPLRKCALEESGALYFSLMHTVVEIHRDSSGLALLFDLLVELAGQVR